MKVKEIMTTDLVTVSPSDRVSDVTTKIVSRKISGVFVVDEGALIGKISHADVLAKVFPSYQELYNDMVHNIDFEEIQTRAREMGDRSARDVMTPEIDTVSPDTPVMKAAAWMLLRDIHRLAVLDDLDRLVGVISRGDIFYHTLDQEMVASQATIKPSKARVGGLG